MSLDLEAIEAAHGPRTTELSVPEWGGTVTAKRLTISDHLRIERLSAKGSGERDNGEYAVRLVQASLIGEDGLQLIGDDKLHLLTEAHELTMRLAVELMKFNGREDAKKNSESSPSESSLSASAP